MLCMASWLKLPTHGSDALPSPGTHDHAVQSLCSLLCRLIGEDAWPVSQALYDAVNHTMSQIRHNMGAECNVTFMPTPTGITEGLGLKEAEHLAGGPQGSSSILTFSYRGDALVIMMLYPLHLVDHEVINHDLECDLSHSARSMYVGHLIDAGSRRGMETTLGQLSAGVSCHVCCNLPVRQTLEDRLAWWGKGEAVLVSGAVPVQQVLSQAFVCLHAAVLFSTLHYAWGQC